MYGKKSLTPEEKQFKNNTNDTNAELSLFYNIALDRVNELITLYEGKTVYIEKLNFDNFLEQFKKETYLQLKVFFWKEEISNSYTQIKEKDTKLIHEILKKLVGLRNFHSHYYHDCEALKFSKELIEIIYLQFEKAKNQLVAKNPNFQEYVAALEKDEITYTDKRTNEEKTDTYHHFDFFDQNGYIKEEGKNFFLSFFLLKGEMAKFLKKRKRCKKDNGEKYQVKTKLFSFYCHRDNSNRFFLTGKKKYYDDNELLRRQFNTILNYLKTKPVADREYLPPTKEITLRSRGEIDEIKNERKEKQEKVLQQTEIQTLEAEPEKEVIRRSKKFMDLSIRYFMDRNKLGHKDTNIIKWFVKTLKHEEIEKQAASLIKDDEKKQYMEMTVGWKSEFEPGCFPLIKNKHIKFKINEDATEYLINERELKNWLYYLLRDPKKSLDETLMKIQEYGSQYKVAMVELFIKNIITFINYPLVFGRDGNDRRILSEAHLKIIENKKFNKTEYLEKIEKRINTTIEFLKSELNQKDYSRNRKNRTILKCFNWYLPIEAKLKPDEINMLSIYNFVSENKNLNQDTRKSIIQPILYKLTKASHDTFQLIQSAESLDALFENILKKKIKSLEYEQNNIKSKTLDELHQLASKLSVSVPGMDVSKSGKKESREVELKETISKNPALIPNGFFKKVFEESEKLQVSTRIKRNKQWQRLLIEDQYVLQSQDEFINGAGSCEFKKDISKEVLEFVEENYDKLFTEFSKKQGQKHKDFIDLFLNISVDKSDNKRFEIIKALQLHKTLKEVKVQDALLVQILFEYNNLQLPLEEREAKHVNIATLFENEYELKIDNHKTIKLKYKQLDDLATNWDRDKIAKLFNNVNYWNEDLLKELDIKGKKSDQQKILIMMNKVFEDSFYYIKTFLEVEKKVLDKFKNDCLQQLISESRALKKDGMTRIEPDVLIRRLEKITNYQKGKFIELRQSAFHTDIPKDNMKYEKEKDELADLAGIKKQERPDKSKYKK